MQKQKTIYKENHNIHAVTTESIAPTFTVRVFQGLTPRQVEI